MLPSPTASRSRRLAPLVGGAEGEGLSFSAAPHSAAGRPLGKTEAQVKVSGAASGRLGVSSIDGPCGQKGTAQARHTGTSTRNRRDRMEGCDDFAGRAVRGNVQRKARSGKASVGSSRYSVVLIQLCPTFFTWPTYAGLGFANCRPPAGRVAGLVANPSTARTVLGSGSAEDVGKRDCGALGEFGGAVLLHLQTFHPSRALCTSRLLQLDHPPVLDPRVPSPTCPNCCPLRLPAASCQHEQVSVPGFWNLELALHLGELPWHQSDEFLVPPCASVDAPVRGFPKRGDQQSLGCHPHC